MSKKMDLNKEQDSAAEKVKPENQREISASDTSNKRLFGTDGVRGTAGEFPITPDIIVKLGQALGFVLRKKDEIPKVVIGKDTRLSGYMVEQCLSAGLNSMGVHVQLVGPLPTPGIGFVASNMRASAGIVISASHNPYYDNGIKIFGPDGYKISDAQELEIESLIFEQDLNKLLKTHESIGRTKRIDDALGRYLVYVKSTFPLDMSLEGMRIVLDCAHGASYKVAPLIFEELGAEVIVIGNKPDGFNVNKKSGALFPEHVSEAVRKYRADIGITLDGDADRVILCDEIGEIIDGDRILAICALEMKEDGLLSKNTVVATHMSNIGLDHVLQKNGIDVHRVNVGDKYVVEAMRNQGYVLGGEQSGHIVFLNHSTTGDACVAALKVLEAAVKKNKKLSELKNIMVNAPQILKNIRVSQKLPLSQIPGYYEFISKIETKLKNNGGRVFVRYSGTEPVIRILIEASDIDLAKECSEEVSKWIQSQLQL